MIKSIKAREVLDSRGNPTVECDLITEKGLFKAIVPSGASTGKHESLELRDNQKRYNGKGVLKAVTNINKIISKKLIGMNLDQKEIDNLMIGLDGTKHKEKLGANSILAVSMAACKAAAYDENLPLYKHIAKLSKRKGITLPLTQMNIINGGKHAGMENDVQEHMIMPVGAKNVKEAIRMCAETYHALQKILKDKFGSSGIHVADEGGFAPQFDDINERLETLMSAIEGAGYKNEIKLALDCAASEFFKDGFYTINDNVYSTSELVDFYKSLVKTFPIISIEDGMSEDDWEGWQLLNRELGKKIQIVGDDLLVTNPTRIKKAIELKAVNSLLLKVNQIGTVTEAIDAANLAFKNKWTVVVSHRSGETEDSFIADLVVGLDAGQSKFGAPARSERTCKYNQLMRIEEELGEKARYYKL